MKNYLIQAKNSNALCPVRPPQTAIGRPAGTWLGSAPVPVVVSGVAPKTGARRSRRFTFRQPARA